MKNSYSQVKFVISFFARSFPSASSSSIMHFPLPSYFFFFFFQYGRTLFFGFRTVLTQLSRCLETLDGSVSRCFLQMFSHPTKVERREGQGAVSGRAPQGRWVRKERLNYASKRSGSRAFSRSSRCRPLPLSSFVPPGKASTVSWSSLRFTLCVAQSPRCSLPT